jgi:hypothetical protein
MIQELKDLGLELIGTRGDCILRIDDVVYFCSHLGISYIKFDNDSVVEKVENNWTDSLKYQGKSFYEY